MPQTLTADGSTWVEQTAPVAGEARTVQSVVDPLQKAANRAAYVKAWQDANAPSNGPIRKFRTFDTVTTLRNSTDHVDGTMAFVRGFGFFYFRGNDTTDSDPEPYRVRPADVAGGAPGRWQWEFLNIAYPAPTPYGLLSRDATGYINPLDLGTLVDPATSRVKAENVVNGMVYFNFMTLPAFVSSSSAWALLTGSELDLDALFPARQANDKVLVTASVPDGGSSSAQMRVRIEQSSLVTPFVYSAVHSFTTAAAIIGSEWSFAFTMGTARKVRLEAHPTTSGDSVNTLAGGQFIIQVFRP